MLTYKDRVRLGLNTHRLERPISFRSIRLGPPTTIVIYPLKIKGFRCANVVRNIGVALVML